MTVCPDMVNGFGVRHGALVTAVTDSAFAFASNTYDDLTMAAGFDMVLVRPARVGDVLGATATERHRRGRNGSYDVTSAGWIGTAMKPSPGRREPTRWSASSAAAVVHWAGPILRPEPEG